MWAGLAVPRAEVPSDTRPAPPGLVRLWPVGGGGLCEPDRLSCGHLYPASNRLLRLIFRAASCSGQGAACAAVAKVFAELRTRADTFVFAQHGHNSLYFWAEREPPTYLNPTFGLTC